MSVPLPTVIRRAVCLCVAVRPSVYLSVCLSVLASIGVNVRRSFVSEV